MKKTPEELKALEEAVKTAQETADTAHAAAAEAGGSDDGLNTAADTAEDALGAAKQAFSDATSQPDTEEEDTEETDIDFEKELEEIEGAPPVPQDAGAQASKKSELEKAEKSLHFTAERIRKLGGDPTKVLTPKEKVNPPALDDEPDTRFVTKDDLANRDLETEVRKLGRTEQEIKVILHHAKHSIKLTGDAAKDAENAYLIAHKGKIKRSFEEIRRASAARPNPGEAGPGRKPLVTPTKTPALTASEQNILRRRGFKQQQNGTWDSKGYSMRYDATAKQWITEKKTSK